MSKDISNLTSGWPYDADEVRARWIQADDGTRKVQLRLDLGVFQMEIEGRPDGTRTLLFALQNVTDRWTPVSAHYELVVPDWLQNREAAVEIELSGRWSQLWTLGDAVFF